MKQKGKGSIQRNDSKFNPALHAEVAPVRKLGVQVVEN